jgi:hypothetical protein
MAAALRELSALVGERVREGVAGSAGPGRVLDDQVMGVGQAEQELSGDVPGHGGIVGLIAVDLVARRDLAEFSVHGAVVLRGEGDGDGRSDLAADDQLADVGIDVVVDEREVGRAEAEAGVVPQPPAAVANQSPCAEPAMFWWGVPQMGSTVRRVSTGFPSGRGR